jgi:hypothetical protein
MPSHIGDKIAQNGVASIWQKKLKFKGSVGSSQ